MRVCIVPEVIIERCRIQNANRILNSERNLGDAPIALVIGLIWVTFLTFYRIARPRTSRIPIITIDTYEKSDRIHDNR